MYLEKLDSKPFINITSRITCPQDSLLCFFGLGELLYREFNNVLVCCGRYPDFICDNNPMNWGKRFNGIPCISPSELVLFSSRLVVLITIKQYEQIVIQLRSFDIQKIYIVNFQKSTFSVNSFLEVDDSDITSEQTSHYDLDNLLSKLSGRKALVTGASRGFGKDIALMLASFGVNLILTARDVSALQDISHECRGLGVECYYFGVNFSVVNELNHFISLLSISHKIDFLINNAAISPPLITNDFNSFQSLFDECFKVNTLAPIILSTYLMPHMINNAYGRIINISSSILGKPESLHYSCSKAALDKYVLDIHELLSNKDVSICLVDPGWIRTPMTNFQAPNSSRSALNGVLLGLLLNLNGRWISSQDFANMQLEDALKKALAIFNIQL